MLRLSIGERLLCDNNRRHREAGHDAFVAIDLERVESILPVPEGSPLRKAFRLLRGSSLRELDLGLKFDAEKREFTCIVHLPLTGEPDGLLRALTAPDFKATAIPNVPPHAEFFVTASLDLQHGTDLLLELVRLVIGEDARASMEEFSGMPVQESSAALGHRLSLFLGSSNLPGEVFGEYGAFTFEMRDAAVFRRIIKTALGDSTRMERTEFAGATIYTDSDVTFAIGKRQFLFASGRDSAEDALRQGNRSPRQLGPESALPAPSGPVNALLFATPRGVSALLEELFDIEPPSMSDVAQRTVTPTGILGPVRIVGRWLPDHGYELELVLKFR